MINKIQANSALAVVVALASTLIGSSAQAGNFFGFIKDANTLTTDGSDMITSVTLDDGGSNELTFDNFNFLADPGTDFIGDGIRIRYDVDLDEFIFEYAPLNDLRLPDPVPANGKISYDITGTVVPVTGGINQTVVTAAEVDSVVNGISGAFELTVDITTDVDGPYQLFSINGGSNNLPSQPTRTSIVENANILNVMNTLVDGGDTITSLTNAYTATNDNEPIPVPEPGTIIGLLALGGLGLATKGKKQK